MTPSKRFSVAVAGVAAAAALSPLAMSTACAQGPAPTTAAPASTPATTYTAASSVSYPYTAPGVQATITVTRLADTVYRVNITGTTQNTAPTVLPVGFTSGLLVPTGTSPMHSGNGVMNLTGSSVAFTFNGRYLDNYQAPFTFSGGWDVVVTTAQTSTQTITVGGHPYTIRVQAPAASQWADGAGRRIMITRSFEVDDATLRTSTVAGIYFGADNDGGLSYGELARLYTSARYRRDFSEQYRFVTISVPKNATSSELLAAINAKLPTGWAVLSTTARQQTSVKVPVSVTTAWEVQTSKGARPAPGGIAWGPRHDVPELYVASSGQHHL